MQQGTNFNDRRFSVQQEPRSFDPVSGTVGDSASERVVCVILRVGMLMVQRVGGGVTR